MIWIIARSSDLQYNGGMAARLAGMDRVSFMFELDRFGLSPLGVDAGELKQDMANA